MKLTMKPWVVIWAIVLLCVMPQNGNAQNKELEKTQRVQKRWLEIGCNFKVL